MATSDAAVVVASSRRIQQALSTSIAVLCVVLSSATAGVPKRVARAGLDRSRAAKLGLSDGKKGKTKGKKKKRRGHGSAPQTEPTHHLASLPILSGPIRCPDDMVAVAGRVCVDRYESTLVRAVDGELLSPFYPPMPKTALGLFDTWTHEAEIAEPGTLDHDMPVPILPDTHRGTFEPLARSWPSATPSGYVSGEMAQVACQKAGKRLCKEDEWVTACRGERQTQFPYGEKFEANACNVFRDEHPAHLLHGEFSTGLLDPRLNEVSWNDQPLLQVTGHSDRCASAWGDDAVYDMVGNLDEWVDDPEGTFVGGFYSRATRNGCDARVAAHPAQYFDYSTGVRCCADPQ